MVSDPDGGQQANLYGCIGLARGATQVDVMPKNSPFCSRGGHDSIIASRCEEPTRKVFNVDRQRVVLKAHARECPHFNATRREYPHFNAERRHTQRMGIHFNAGSNEWSHPL